MGTSHRRCTRSRRVRARRLVAARKREPKGPAGSRQGLNDYSLVPSRSDMGGQYFGYDGPVRRGTTSGCITTTSCSLRRKSRALPGRRRVHGTAAAEGDDGHVPRRRASTGPTLSIRPFAEVFVVARTVGARVRRVVSGQVPAPCRTPQRQRWSEAALRSPGTTETFASIRSRKERR